METLKGLHSTGSLLCEHAVAIKKKLMFCFKDKKHLHTVVLNKLQNKLNLVVQYPMHTVFSIWQY